MHHSTQELSFSCAGSQQGRPGCPPTSEPCAWLLEPALPRTTLGSRHSFGVQGCVLSQQELGLSWEDAALLLWWPRAHPSPRQVMESSVRTSCPTLAPAPGQGFEGLGWAPAVLHWGSLWGWMERKSCLLSDPCGGGFATRDWCFSSFSGTAGPKGCGAVGSI